MKKFIKLFTVILIISILSMTTYGCKPEVLATADNPFALEGLGVRPEGEKIADRNVDVEGEDAIALAVELYELACLNDKLTDCRATFSLCPTSNIASGMDNKILLNILELKNDNEYYRIDYRLKDDIPLFNMFPYAEGPINDSIQLVTTERRYANTDMEYTRYQIINNAQTNENGIPYADWSKTEDIVEKTDPEEGGSKPRIFSSSQSGDYRKSDHVIAEDTVSSAEVTYNADEGIYSVTMELDCTRDPETDFNKATQYTRPLIQEGSGADNAHYENITISFEMWDNGFFKSFDSDEYWTASMKIVISINVESTFNYHDVYSYNPNDCVVSKYYNNGNFVDNYNTTE